jgi:hypothetical protein
MYSLSFLHKNLHIAFYFNPSLLHLQERDFMKTQKEYIQLIASSAQELRKRFGVRSMQLFGSVARNEQHDGSDVDICVDMPPKLFLIIELKQYLEELFGCPVDVVRKHRNMNEFLQAQIEKDGIYVLR